MKGEKFAKLFEMPDGGQLLIKKDLNDEGEIDNTLVTVK